MTLLDRFLDPIRSANGIEVKNLGDLKTYSTVDSFGGAGVAPPYDTQNYEETYTTVSYVYRAVNAIADAIVQLPIQIQSQVKDEWLNVTTSEFEVLSSYNDFMTGEEFWQRTIISLELTGESFWLLKRDARGFIVALFPIPPSCMDVHPKNDFQVDYYTFHPSQGGGAIRLEEKDVFFIKFPSPANGIRGLSPMSAAKADIVLDQSAVISSQRQFSQGFRPSGVFSTDQNMSKAVWERLLSYLQKEYSGSVNTGKALMLTDGLKWEQLSLSNEELQYLGQRQWSKDVVGVVYGVTPVIMMQFKDASVLANADVQVKLFWEQTIKPLTVKLEAIFTDFLLPQISHRKGLRFKWDFSSISVIQPDQNKVVERFERGFKVGGVTPNQMAEALGLPRSKDAGMDLHYIPMGMIPLEQSGANLMVNDKPEDKKPEKTPEEVEDDKYLTTLLRKSNKSMGMEVDEDEPSFIMQKFNVRIKKAEAFGSMNRNIVSVGHKFKPVLLDLLNQQAKEVLDNVRADKGMTVQGYCKSVGIKFKKVHEKYTVEGVTFDYEEWAKKFEEAGQPFIAMAFRQAALDLADSIGEEFWVENPASVAWMNKRDHDYAQMVNGTTRDDINRIIARSLEENLTTVELAKSLEQYFNNNNSVRAIRIARTETVVATNAGRIDAMKQSNRIKDHMWLSQRDSDVRDIPGDDHTALDGTVVKVGASFPGNGGSDSAFPSSPNERCLTIPFKIDPKKN